MEKENYLKNGERLDDLQLNGLHIIQNPEKFCFGMDAVLLSSFCAKTIRKKDNRGKIRRAPLSKGNLAKIYIESIGAYTIKIVWQALEA